MLPRRDFLPCGRRAIDLSVGCALRDIDSVASELEKHMSVDIKHQRPDRSAASPLSAQKPKGFLHWWQKGFRGWQRQRMIATLAALDDRTLSDIGLRRGDIERVVDGFDDTELRMAPIGSEPKSLDLSCGDRRRAAQSAAVKKSRAPRQARHIRSA